MPGRINPIPPSAPTFVKVKRGGGLVRVDATGAHRRMAEVKIYR